MSERTKEIGARSFEFTVAPSYAGRFELPTAKFSTGDLMGLFVGQVTLPLGLTVECLPLSLLSRVHTADVSPLTIGENPVGRKGSGQELYSIGEYLPNTDTKDILWKRVARAEDESMPIRVREANVRASVTLAVALGWKSEDERTRTVDLALEAIAQIGTTLLSVGTSLSIAYPAGKSLAVEDGSTVSELADALIETAGTVNAVPDESMRDLALECDLLLMTRDKAESRALGMTRSKPVLVLSEQPTSVGSTDASVFTGTEDLSGLTMMVLSR